MTYYEELGVGSDASIEEIRQAYKTLARLVHPDSQTDERLKAVAERQMQRLNEILGILTDRQRRRLYDEGLAGPRAGVAAAWGAEGPLAKNPSRRAPPVPETTLSRGVEWAQPVAWFWLWALIGTTCAGTAVMWWAMAPKRNVPEAPPVRPARAPVLQTEAPQERPLNSSNPPASKPREQHSAVQARFAPAARTREAEPALSDPPPSAAVQSQAPEAPGKALETPREPKPSADPKPAESMFAGNWLYLPQAGETADLGEYPPVYIEFLLAEESGDLVGSYHARYRVPDKAVSPEVVLRIRSRAPLGKSTRVEWASNAGAKGVLEMTLRAPGLLRVAWWTTEFGSQPQLTSGIALLVRQQAP